MVNVLYLHNSSMISGGERSLLQLWANLDRAVFVPHVVIPSEGPLADEARRAGVDVHISSVPSLRPWSVVALARTAAALAKIIESKKIGLIHSYTPRNNLVAAWVARRKGIPVIWHERNLVWGAETDVTRLFLGWPRAVICNSRAVAKRFERKGSLPKHVRVILNGVDLVQFSSGIDKVSAKQAMGWEGKKIVGLVSNLNARKGVETFLAVVSLICRSRRDILFVVVGGDYGAEGRLAELCRRAQDMGLGEQVIFTAFQSDVRPYLAAFDVSCNVTEKEACSRAILESMAMGVPVVAFRDGGNPELVEEHHGGVLVPTGDNVVFASRVLGLVDNDKERQRMGGFARTRAQEKFDVKRNAQETMALYRELLTTSGVPFRKVESL